MKILPRMMLGTLLGLCCTASALAQSNYDPYTPKTRAQVIADLHEWRAAGYDPGEWWHYPQNAERASRIVAAKRAQAAGMGN